MAKRGYQAESERRKILESSGWFVLRVSGSIGPMDLIAIKPSSDNTFRTFRVIIEQVKSSKSDTFHFSKQAIDEWQRLLEIEKNYGIPCYFSILLRKNRRKVWAILPVREYHPKTIKALSVKPPRFKFVY